MFIGGGRWGDCHRHAFFDILWCYFINDKGFFGIKRWNGNLYIKMPANYIYNDFGTKRHKSNRRRRIYQNI